MAGRDPSTLSPLEINTGFRHLILNNGLFWGFNCSSRGGQELGSDQPWRSVANRAANTPRAGAGMLGSRFWSPECHQARVLYELWEDHSFSVHTEN